MIVAFTGHRPMKLGGYDSENPIRRAVRAALRDVLTIVKPKPLAAITGMAQGFDQDAAHVCLDLDIPFMAAVPFHGQELHWPEHAQREYHALLERATSVVYITPQVRGLHAARKALMARNRWMVDNSDALIAAWDGTDGGTHECIKYASWRGRPMLFINPQAPFDTVELLKSGAPWQWNLE